MNINTIIPLSFGSSTNNLNLKVDDTGKFVDDNSATAPASKAATVPHAKVYLASLLNMFASSADGSPLTYIPSGQSAAIAIPQSTAWNTAKDPAQSGSAATAGYTIQPDLSVTSGEIKQGENNLTVDNATKTFTRIS